MAVSKRRFNRYNLFFAALVMVIIPEIFFRAGMLTTSNARIEREIGSFIERNINTAEKKLRILLNDTSHIFPEHSFNPVYIVFENNRPVTWTGEHTPLVYPRTQSIDTNKLYSGYLGDGFYVQLTKTKGDRRATAFLRITHRYKFTNPFLAEHFTDGLDIPGWYRVYDPGTGQEGDLVPVTHHGVKLFNLINTETQSHVSEITGIVVGFQLAGLFMLFIALVNFAFLFAHRSPYMATLGIILLLLVIKICLSVFVPFELIKQSKIFNPELFASSAFDPSLGDFLLSFLVFFSCCYFLYRNYFLFLQGNKKRFLFYVLVSGCILIVGQLMLMSGLKNLVMNSQIDFFFRNIHSLNSYTIIGIFSLGIGLFGILFILSRLRNYFIQYPPIIRGLLLMHFAFLLIMNYYWAGEYFYQLLFFSALLLAYIAWPVKYALSPFNSTSIVLISFSILSTTIFFNATKKKERNHRLLLADKLADSQDPDMEFDFGALAKPISTDRVLWQYHAHGNRTGDHRLDDYLDKKYFGKISGDYDLEYLFFKNDSVSMFPNQYRPARLREDQEIISLYGKRTSARNLHFIYNRYKGLDYIAVLPLYSPDDNDRQLLIEFKSKKIPTQSGLHELLTDNNQFYSNLVSDYSFVRYVNNNITDQHGVYMYKSNPAIYDPYKLKYQFFDDDEYEHLLYRASNNSFVIISKPFANWLTHVTSFSYILILFALEFLIISFGLYNIKIAPGFFNLSAKIQMAFIALTILAMVLFGLTTQYAIGNQYKLKNRSLVSEKLEALNEELRHKLAQQPGMVHNLRMALPTLFEEFSKVFKSDINFYSRRGVLLASTAGKVYRYGIQTRLMNPLALHMLTRNFSPQYIQEESIGQMRFTSGYLPFYGTDNRLLGYINIPYFPEKSAIDSEFSSLLMAIINIFVVLFAFTILISVIVTQIIVLPLNKIRESIAAMQLNKVNKPIIYKGRDELADLVKEYNNKVADLEKYAFYLAQNEREIAWREMAKQVAHEIKNPLTPMKLNIQHLQRSLKPDDPEFETKLNRVSQSLIEQIDILTNIASEFSSLAKMPGSNLEKLNYNALLENIIELYNEDELTDIELVTPPGILYINADKEQLLRVLNNLVKNAQQAIPENRKGRIELKVEVKNDKLVTYVIDNGMGISPEQKDRIFQPNFTSKSTGSGLGLAMVKTIVEQHGGIIYFETSYGVGTTFIFELPLTGGEGLHV